MGTVRHSDALFRAAARAGDPLHGRQRADGRPPDDAGGAERSGVGGARRDRAPPGRLARPRAGAAAGRRAAPFRRGVHGRAPAGRGAARRGEGADRPHACEREPGRVRPRPRAHGARERRLPRRGGPARPADQPGPRRSHGRARMAPARGARDDGRPLPLLQRPAGFRRLSGRGDAARRACASRSARTRRPATTGSIPSARCGWRPLLSRTARSLRRAPGVRRAPDGHRATAPGASTCRAWTASRPAAAPTSPSWIRRPAGPSPNPGATSRTPRSSIRWAARTCSRRSWTGSSATARATRRWEASSRRRAEVRMAVQSLKAPNVPLTAFRAPGSPAA